jgi:MYXO-CTERM domain-containing protein
MHKAFWGAEYMNPLRCHQWESPRFIRFRGRRGSASRPGGTLSWMRRVLAKRGIPQTPSSAAAARRPGGGTPHTRWIAATIAVATMALDASATPPSADHSIEAAALPETEAPRVCTPLGCVGAPSSPWTYAASFGAAVLAAGWLGRRRRTRSGTALE